MYVLCEIGFYGKKGDLRDTLRGFLLQSRLRLTEPLDRPGTAVLRLPAHLVPQPVLPVNLRGKLHTQARMQRAGCGPHILYLFSGNAAGRSQTTLWVSNLGATPWGGHQYRRTFPGGGNWGAETLNDQQEWRNEGLNQVSMTPVQQQHSSARSVFLFVLFFCHTAWLAGF